MIFDVDKVNWRKTGVYKITNKVNGKIYIGSTTTNFRHRFLQYRSGFKRKLENQPILYRAFNKYGFDYFAFEIIQVCEIEECLKLEQFYIDKGTDYNSCLVAGSLLGFKHSETSKTRTIVGGLHHCAVKVEKYSIEGVFIKSYDSVTEACNENGIISKANIIQCCKGKVFSSGNFRWAFKESKLSERPNRLGKHKVRISKENLIKEFNSHGEAAKYFNEIGFKKVKQGAISNAIRLKNNLYNFKIEKICSTS